MNDKSSLAAHHLLLTAKYEQPVMEDVRQAIKLSLERVKACLEYLGNPQNTFKSVLIGGTNGKGSVTYYLSNLASKYTTYKIGRYISPHLISWNERYVINEKIVDDLKINQVFEEVIKKIQVFEKESNQKEKLTEFEIYTVIAFYLFAQEKVDIAFLEVGMGGRLDATNVAISKNTLCSVITNISLDHTQHLGKTIEKIAFEKAGIIKENNYVITGVDKTLLSIIEKQARELNTQVISINDNNETSYIDKDIEIALKAWEIILKQLDTKKQRNREAEDLELFLKKLIFPGRFQYIKEHKVLLDGAHNPQAAYELRKLIERDFNNKRKVYIIGMLDKDYDTFLKNLLRKDSIVICTEPKSKRATKKEILAKCVKKIGSKAIMSNDLREAIQIAKKEDHDLIVITGSLYLIGEALELVCKNIIVKK